MTATQSYLQAVKDRYELPSNYKLAQVLGVSRSLVGLQMKAKAGMGDAQAIKVAELLELDALEVLAELHAERAQDDKARAYWRELANKARGAAAAVILSALAWGGGSQPAAAEIGLSDATRYTLCAILRALAGAARRALEAAHSDDGLDAVA